MDHDSRTFARAIKESINGFLSAYRELRTFLQRTHVLASGDKDIEESATLEEIVALLFAECVKDVQSVEGELHSIVTLVNTKLDSNMRFDGDSLTNLRIILENILILFTAQQEAAAQFDDEHPPLTTATTTATTSETTAETTTTISTATAVVQTNPFEENIGERDHTTAAATLSIDTDEFSSDALQEIAENVSVWLGMLTKARFAAAQHTARVNIHIPLDDNDYTLSSDEEMSSDDSGENSLDDFVVAEDSDDKSVQNVTH